eukprot:3895097-Prymnesium_polylepis.1
MSTHGKGGRRVGRTGDVAGGRPAAGRRQAGGRVRRAPRQYGCGAARCDIALRTVDKGRHSCRIPIVHERCRHPGTDLGAARPVGT